MKKKFNDLTPDELAAKRVELTGKVRELRFEMVMGHVENPMEKKNLRRQIARLNTIINEYEIGIRKA
ncbi:MAG: 50S ribosomal protein L29 [Spirochaetes bacterium]|nr:MAG: 50S ribosomal protein L29 [Spirochaetota bacterium]RKX89691.1 MAG: 50S ribosomal protein L29 [Spirochaetota bacterium]RKX96194.1 MAG: 50S ribosomal protein L29 [Spirochaetota bacterium]